MAEREARRVNQLNLVCQLLGITEYECLDFDDNSFDTVGVLNISRAVEKSALGFNPDIVLTHSISDLNVDHEITARAVITAFRPAVCDVESILGFYIPSSSDWGSF